MTTKTRARRAVELGMTDDDIVLFTNCHPECVEFVRAWGRGERVEQLTIAGWLNLDDPTDRRGVRYRVGSFLHPQDYRIAPRLIRATAELPDGRTVEAEWPEPVRDISEIPSEGAWIASGNDDPLGVGGLGDAFESALMGAMRAGRLHLTREAALQHDRAMIKLNGGEVE